MNYYNHFNMEVEGTYIISIEGNEVSQKLTQNVMNPVKK